VAGKTIGPDSPYLDREVTAKLKLGRADESARLNSALNPFKPLNPIPTDRGTPREEMERQTVDVERFRAK